MDGLGTFGQTVHNWHAAKTTYSLKSLGLEIDLPCSNKFLSVITLATFVDLV